MKKLLLIISFIFTKVAIADSGPCITNLENASPAEASQAAVDYVSEVVPHSYTRNIIYKPAKTRFTGSLNREVDDPVHEIIEKYRRDIQSDFSLTHAEKHEKMAIAAMETGCGDCGEMNDVGELFSKKAKYPGTVTQMEFGNHAVLLFEREPPYIAWVADSWTPTIVKTYPFEDWPKYLVSYKQVPVVVSANDIRHSGQIVFPYEIPGITPKPRKDTTLNY